MSMGKNVARKFAVASLALTGATGLGAGSYFAGKSFATDRDAVEKCMVRQESCNRAEWKHAAYQQQTMTTMTGSFLFGGSALGLSFLVAWGRGRKKTGENSPVTNTENPPQKTGEPFTFDPRKHLA